MKNPKHPGHELAHSHGPRPASSINKFCANNGFCRSYFYKLVKSGNGPRIIKLGRRVIITAEAEDDWRLAMEARTAAQAKDKDTKSLTNTLADPPPDIEVAGPQSGSVERSDTDGDTVFQAANPTRRKASRRHKAQSAPAMQVRNTQ